MSSKYEYESGLLVAVGYSDPGDGSGVAAQEEKRDVAGGGHQVDHHGHADGAQSRQVQLLHQQPPEEDTQTGAWDGCHSWGGNDNDAQNLPRNVDSLVEDPALHGCSIFVRLMVRNRTRKVRPPLGRGDDPPT